MQHTFAELERARVLLLLFLRVRFVYVVTHAGTAVASGTAVSRQHPEPAARWGPAAAR